MNHNLTELQAAATAGDGESCCRLGHIYFDGLDGERDIHQAIHWFKQAADNQEGTDTPPKWAQAACVNLARLYATGFGIEKDMPQAIAWYDRAAAHGHAEALYERGLLHLNEDEPAAALACLQKAAAKDHPAAQFKLAEMLRQAVEKNEPEAVCWLERAARNGHREAQAQIGWRHAWGEMLPFDLVKAYAWLYKAALAGHIFAGLAKDELAQEMTPGEIAAALQMQTALGHVNIQ